MKSITTFLCLLLFITTYSQENQQKPATQLTYLPTAVYHDQSSVQLLNSSPFIPVVAGDIFNVSTGISLKARPHYLLRGVLKTVGIGAASYAISGSLSGNNGAKGNFNLSHDNLLISSALGLAVGAKDLSKGLRNNKVYITYSLYSKDSLLLSQYKVKLTHKTASLADQKAAVDGFLQVAVVGRPENTIPGTLSVNVASNAVSAPLKGAVANQMSLESEGECLWERIDPEADQAGINDPCSCITESVACLAVAWSAAVAASWACIGPQAPACYSVVTVGYLAALTLC